MSPPCEFCNSTTAVQWNPNGCRCDYFICTPCVLRQWMTYPGCDTCGRTLWIFHSGRVYFSKIDRYVEIPADNTGRKVGSRTSRRRNPPLDPPARPEDPSVDF